MCHAFITWETAFEHFRKCSLMLIYAEPFFCPPSPTSNISDLKRNFQTQVKIHNYFGFSQQPRKSSSLVAIQFYLCWVHIISKYILEIIAPRKAALSKWLALTCMPNLTFFQSCATNQSISLLFFFPFLSKFEQRMTGQFYLVIQDAQEIHILKLIPASFVKCSLPIFLNLP